MRRQNSGQRSAVKAKPEQILADVVGAPVSVTRPEPQFGILPPTWLCSWLVSRQVAAGNCGRHCKQVAPAARNNRSNSGRARLYQYSSVRYRANSSPAGAASPNTLPARPFWRSIQTPIRLPPMPGICTPRWWGCPKPHFRGGRRAGY